MSKRTFRGLVVATFVVLFSLTSAWAADPLKIVEKPPGSVDLSSAIVKVAKQIIPAVVYIEVTESRVVENPFGPLGNDPFFRRFFGLPNMPKKFKQEMKGLGSGMIIDSQGHILTNYHVAGNATKMEVTLADGSKYPATLVGGDARTDLAVIHISAQRALPFVTFGDSDKTDVGEWVVAVGAPRALEKSVTQGIISAKHRTGINDPHAYEDFLQTDAPINPGNSGGPLLNLYGQVIGVNAAIATESGGFEGIGFTVPEQDGRLHRECPYGPRQGREGLAGGEHTRSHAGAGKRGSRPYVGRRSRRRCREGRAGGKGRGEEE